MKAKEILPAVLALCISFSARAQFYSYGNDRGSIRWSSIETPTYRLVYPRGLDSLARVYAFNLEKVAGPVGSSIGNRPNASFKKKMPVILHPYSASANGMVTLLPRRMELLTNPEVYNPEVLPWVRELSIHESRHVAQFQFANSHGFRFWNALLGEFSEGALTAVYCGPAFDEGDAVMTETALTDAGRGRSADFLEYMRQSFSEGQYRDYWKWRYGSQNLYTPDYYKVGYITMAGVRTLYDSPSFTKDYFDRINAHHGIAFLNFQKAVRDAGGRKFKDSFREICEKLDSTWRKEALSRAPYTPAEAVTQDKRLYTEYFSLQEYGNSLLALRKGIAETTSLVRIWNDGTEEKIRDFSSSTSTLHASPLDGRVWWTEYRKNPRWSLESYSDVRYMDLDGRVRTLTKGHRYYNPAPADGRVAVTELNPDGSEAIVTLDSDTAEILASFAVPDGLQAVETAWLDGKLYLSAISDDGFGIYEVPDFKPVLNPQKAKIKRLASADGHLAFTSDLGGTDEIYSFNPSSGELLQLTSTVNGTGHFVFASDTLYFTMPGTKGRNIYKTASAGLRRDITDFSLIHRYEMAEKLSEGETDPVPECFGTPISEPQDYSKPGHALKVHSWLPLYFNCDDVSNLSYETIYQSAGIGATAYFQNELSTVSGLAGIHVDHTRNWRPSAHLKLNWTGLYPVFEAQVDINERIAESRILARNDDGSVTTDISPRGSTPSAYLSVRSYIPLSVSSGGWTRGLVPQLRFSLSNDEMKWKEGNTASSAPSNLFAASLRAYAARSIPNSCIFPRFGIGMEAGYSARLGFTDVFCANVYGMLYGYVPGILNTHGIKLTAAVQHHASDGVICEAYMKTTPRGFSLESGAFMSSYPMQSKFTVDYAFPFAPVGWSWLCPAAYVRNFEMTLHADYGLYSAGRSAGTSLYSAGADLTARLGNFLWIPYDTRIGVEYEHLGGEGYDVLVKNGRQKSGHYVGLVFSVDF